MSKDVRNFQVKQLDWEQIHELPDGWPVAKLIELLARLEVDGVAESDAMEMVLLALQDLEPDEAADRVLETVFGESMRPGVRQGLVHDLRGERPWVNSAEISRQAGIFNAVVLLQRAFPRDYGKPDAASIQIRVETASATGGAWLDAEHPDPALLLRILAAGMDDSAVLRRLFQEALAGSSFAEAGAILWHVSRRPAAAPAREFQLISSDEWLAPLREIESWPAEGWLDAPEASGAD